MNSNNTNNYLSISKNSPIPPKYFCHIREELNTSKKKTTDNSSFLVNALAGLATINTINIKTEKNFPERKF